MTDVYGEGRLYFAGTTTRISLHQARTRTFDTRRRGLDPDQVHDYQMRVVAELTALHREAWLLRQENHRLKRALRDWQTRQTRQHGAPHQRYPPDVRR